MEASMEELLTTPIHRTETIRQAWGEADSFKQECGELWKKVDKLAIKLRAAAKLGPGNLYGRPTRKIMTEVDKTLEKALALLRKCKRSGMLKRVITITSAGDFKKVSIMLDNSFADVAWLLNVSDTGEDRQPGGVPPIAITDPVLAQIWELIAKVQVGNPEEKKDGAWELASWAKGNPRNGKLIIDEGGLPPLLRLLQDGNVLSQEAAADALGVLAVDHQRVMELLEERAVETFVAILTNGSMKVQVKVAWALSQMVEVSEEAKDQFARAGAIFSLVSLLGYDTLEETSKIQHPSIHTVVKHHKEMAKSKPEPPSKPVDGVEDVSSDHDHEGSRGSLIGMSKPAESPSDVRDKPHHQSAGQESSRLGQQQPGVPKRAPGGGGGGGGYGKPVVPRPSEYTIRATSFDNRSSPESRGGSVGPYARHHRHDRDKEDPKTKQKLKAEAARALWKLASGNVKNSKSITDTRALLCFAKLIESGEPEVKSNSVMAVMEIAKAAEQDAELRRAAFKTNSPAAKAVVEQLLKVIDKGDELQIPCIRAIGCLARIFPARAVEVIRPLTNQLKNQLKEEKVSEEAAIALQRFANEDNYLHKEHSRTILEHGGADALEQIIYFDFEPLAKVEAMVLLSHLVLNVGDSEALNDKTLKALESATRWPELQEDVNNRNLLFEAIKRLELYQAGTRVAPEGSKFLV